MKLIYRNFISAFALVAMVIAMVSCQKADPEFIHDNNLISDMRIKMSTGAEGIAGKIYEYNAAGELVPTEQVTLAAVRGGYGRIVFELDPASNVNPEHCYLSASLSLSEIVTPGLAGRWNITNRDADGVAQGIQFTCTAGNGDKRVYTVVGYYIGEYQLTEN